MSSFLNRLPFRRKAGASPPGSDSEPAAPHKWLPVIDTDSCNGCGLCLRACEHGCLGMVWSFATLLEPQDCGSEGHCMDACPESVIAMGWVALERGPGPGRWNDDEGLPGAGLDDSPGSPT